MPPMSRTAPAGPTEAPLPARFLTQVTVRDPVEGTLTELEIWHDPTSGALFGLDASFLDQVDDAVRSPYNPDVALWLHEDALAAA